MRGPNATLISPVVMVTRHLRSLTFLVRDSHDYRKFHQSYRLLVSSASAIPAADVTAGTAIMVPVVMPDVRMKRTQDGKTQ